MLCVPDTLQVHGANFHDVANLLTLQDSIPSTTGHTGNVEQLGAVDHVVVCETISLIATRATRYKRLPSLRATQMPLAST